MATESQATSRVSTVRLLSQSERPSPQTGENASPPSSLAFHQAALGSLTAIATLLPARFILLLAGVGAFVLHFLAVQNPDTMRLLTAGGYDLLVFIPTTYLYVTRG